MKMKYGGKKEMICVLVIGALLMNNFIVLQSIYSNQGGYASDANYSSYEIEPVQYSFTPPVDGDIWYFSEEKKEWIVDEVISIAHLNSTYYSHFVDNARLQYKLQPDYSFESDMWITTCTIDNHSYVLGLDTVDGNIDMGYPSKEGAFNISIEKACEIFEDTFGHSTETKLVTVAGSRYWALLTNGAKDDVPLIHVRSGEMVYLSELVDDYPGNSVNPLVFLGVATFVAVLIMVALVFFRRRRRRSG
jgi:hypothetical protein